MGEQAQPLEIPTIEVAIDVDLRAGENKLIVDPAVVEIYPYEDPPVPGRSYRVRWSLNRVLRKGEFLVVQAAPESGESPPQGGGIDITRDDPLPVFRVVESHGSTLTSGVVDPSRIPTTPGDYLWHYSIRLLRPDGTAADSDPWIKIKRP
jgi:hypothetical protein